MRRPRLISLLVFIFLIFLRIFVDSSEKLVNIVAMINGGAFAIVLFDVLDRLRVKIIQKIKCNTAAKTITQREVMLFTKKYYVFTYCMVKESSRTKYESVMMNHIFPSIGHIALQKLTSQHVQRLYNQKFREGKSAKTIKDIHGILHKPLEKAVQLGYLQRNICNGCDLPKAIQKEMRPIKDEEVVRFLRAIQGTRYEYLFYVAVFTGMRQGELLGLTWDCINFERGFIKIYRQLQPIKRSGDEYVFSTLKSRTSRIIEPAPAVIEVLRKLKVQQHRWQEICGDAWCNPDSLVFTNEIGGHLCHFTVYKHFKKIVESIGLNDVRFHDMRHTFAVLSLETGADMKTVSSTMGHATVAFTMDKYGHVSNTMRRANAEKMQRYIEGLT